VNLCSAFSWKHLRWRRWGMARVLEGSHTGTPDVHQCCKCWAIRRVHCVNVLTSY